MIIASIMSISLGLKLKLEWMTLNVRCGNTIRSSGMRTWMEARSFSTSEGRHPEESMNQPVQGMGIISVLRLAHSTRVSAASKWSSQFSIICTHPLCLQMRRRSKLNWFIRVPSPQILYLSVSPTLSLKISQVQLSRTSGSQSQAHSMTISK